MEKEAKKLLLERFAHLLAALVIFLKGVAILGTPGKTTVALLFILISLLFLALVVFHRRIQEKIGPLKPAVFFLEALAIGLIGYLYLKAGKVYLPYAYLAAFLAYAALAVFTFFKKPPRTV